MASAEDARWMALALRLGQTRLGQVAPNPAVGCVIVREGRVLGRGVTAIGGRPHAETEALNQARGRYGAEALRGATAYVALEPCAHHGRTPPCADALVAAGIARVVCPIADPDPRVNGRGFARLEAGGVKVEIGVLAAEAEALQAGFLMRIRAGRPHLTLKLAVTLDGRIATARGQSRWITGPQSRARVHLMRARSDAVLVGAATARIDDPMLDVRGLGEREKPPVRVVADGGLSLPLTGRLARSAGELPLWLLHRDGAARERAQAFEALGARLLPVPVTEGGRLDMSAALALLAREGITRVLCEGGGHIAAALVAEGLADEIALFQAGKLFGGDGLTAVQGFGLGRIEEAPAYRLLGHERLGQDVMTRWARA